MTHAKAKITTTRTLGFGLIAIALVLLAGLGIWLADRNSLIESQLSGDAVLYIDVAGRIAVDGTLQLTGPAPVPVSAGSHTLTFFDARAQEPTEVSVEKDQFLYVPGPGFPYRPSNTEGVVQASAFPPDTTIEIPDCTPTTAKHPRICKGKHTLSPRLSPGTYTIRYLHPHLGTHEEEITVTADSTVRHSHSFVTTVTEWDQWRQQYGDIIERRYPTSYRRHGIGGAVLLPFEATGALLGDLFD